MNIKLNEESVWELSVIHNWFFLEWFDDNMEKIV